MRSGDAGRERRPRDSGRESRAPSSSSNHDSRSGDPGRGLKRRDSGGDTYTRRHESDRQPQRRNIDSNVLLTRNDQHGKSTRNPYPASDNGQYPPSGHGTYSPSSGGQRLQPTSRSKLQNEPRRRQFDGGRPVSPHSPPPPPLSPTAGRRRGRGEETRGDRPPATALHPPPRKVGLDDVRKFVPNNHQIQETARAVETVSDASRTAFEVGMDIRDMLRRNKQGQQPLGRNDGRYGVSYNGPNDGRDGYSPGPGYSRDGPGGYGPDDGPERRGGYNDTYGPAANNFSSNEVDDDGVPDGRGPDQFNERPAYHSAPSSGRGRNSGRGDSFAQSPGGYASTPTDDDCTPSPDGGRPKAFDNWPAPNNPQFRAPPADRLPKTGTTRGQNGPSPLGPALRTQAQDDSTSPDRLYPFTDCRHTLRYGSRPPGAGPFDYEKFPSEENQPTGVRYTGRCRSCDTKYRRDQEQEILKEFEVAYQGEVRTITARKRCELTIDERKEIKLRHRAERDAKIQKLWAGWNMRWPAIVVDDFAEDGKAVLKETGL